MLIILIPASLNGKTLAVSVDNQADPAKVDLLYSDNAKAIAAGEAVDLAFKHKLSQIVIAVGSDETLPDISGLKISLCRNEYTSRFLIWLTVRWQLKRVKPIST